MDKGQKICAKCNHPGGWHRRSEHTIQESFCHAELCRCKAFVFKGKRGK